ncbi:tRNA-uridine aminocarboxypropyltransferase [Massilia endophytica]|uniref:tRNA-uridine aminocarboxypropyltransferase n=1 Tax=Massilia endophytica TaxID=2899220 RepID=UPI001E303819|nr:tRNA-uridine aminocarboxypropyltransferase [Massilia endophytica]UGQ44823.1 DTW domain-containing protein [Massilia endophytica]
MTSQRPACATCLRAQSACICSLVQPVSSRARVLVLQHPLEVANAKNSARLLHLCLPNSELHVGERFEDAGLAAMLDGRRAVLLYPDIAGVAAPPALDEAWLSVAESILLVVLDATWRKSRKMLYLNPRLQALPRLALREIGESRYAIRKAHAPGQLSTMEAAAHALAQLEGEGFSPLLGAFEGFVKLQQALAAQGAALRAAAVSESA